MRADCLRRAASSFAWDDGLQSGAAAGYMTYLFTAFAISIGLYMVSVDKIRAAKNKEPDCPMACFVITGCTCCCCAPCLWLCLCFGARPPPAFLTSFPELWR